MQTRSNPPLPTRSRAFARKLRQSQTEAEMLLWRHLRTSYLLGFKFRRQHPMPPYVLDLDCLSEAQGNPNRAILGQ